MAVRTFKYQESKDTMTKIQEEAEKVKKYLDKCDAIVEENVGVENRWSGQRANEYKSKWKEAAADFNNFVQLINDYANKIDQSYMTHKKFDESKN